MQPALLLHLALAPRQRLTEAQCQTLALYSKLMLPCARPADPGIPAGGFLRLVVGARAQLLRRPHQVSPGHCFIGLITIRSLGQHGSACAAIRQSQLQHRHTPVLRRCIQPEAGQLTRHGHPSIFAAGAMPMQPDASSVPGERADRWGVQWTRSECRVRRSGCGCGVRLRSPGDAAQGIEPASSRWRQEGSSLNVQAAAAAEQQTLRPAPPTGCYLIASSFEHTTFQFDGHVSFSVLLST